MRDDAIKQGIKKKHQLPYSRSLLFLLLLISVTHGAGPAYPLTTKCCSSATEMLFYSAEVIVFSFFATALFSRAGGEDCPRLPPSFTAIQRFLERRERDRSKSAPRQRCTQNGKRGRRRRRGAGDHGYFLLPLRLLFLGRNFAHPCRRKNRRRHRLLQSRSRLFFLPRNLDSFSSSSSSSPPFSFAREVHLSLQRRRRPAAAVRVSGSESRNSPSLPFSLLGTSARGYENEIPEKMYPREMARNGGAFFF